MNRGDDYDNDGEEAGIVIALEEARLGIYNV